MVAQSTWLRAWNVGPVTRRCRHCSRDLTESYYTVALAESRNRFGEGTDTPVCNTCRTLRRGGISPGDQSKTWAPFMRPAADPRARGACAGADPSIFEPETPQQIAAAAWAPYCDSCPVTAACAQLAETLNATGNVWAGRYIPEHPAKRRNPEAVAAYEETRKRRRGAQRKNTT